MNKLLKSIYYKIICYDPIIETLYTPQVSNESSEKNYVASPIFITRRQKRQFYFSNNDDDSKSNNLKS